MVIPSLSLRASVRLPYHVSSPRSGRTGRAVFLRTSRLSRRSCSCVSHTGTHAGSRPWTDSSRVWHPPAYLRTITRADTPRSSPPGHYVDALTLTRPSSWGTESDPGQKKAFACDSFRRLDVPFPTGVSVGGVRCLPGDGRAATLGGWPTFKRVKEGSPVRSAPRAAPEKVPSCAGI